MRDDWEKHWKEYNESAEENPAQKYRRELIFGLFDSHTAGQGMRVLDIGSGQGDMAAAIHAGFPAAAIMGVELSQTGVEISARKVPGARFVQHDLMKMLEPPADQRAWATHAICSEVIEHVDDPSRLLKNARAYMAPGCRLVVTAPGGPMSAFDKHIGHRKHWRRTEVEALLRQSGYEPEVVTGAGFPFFNLYRCVVILRGKKLVDDVSARGNSPAAGTARTVMTAFDRLFRLNLNSSPWGWQIVASARPRETSG